MYKRGKWGRIEANISEIQRLLGHQSNSYVNDSVHQLVSDGFLKEMKSKGKQYLRLTWQGFYDIFPFIIPKLFIFFLILVSASLLAYVTVTLLLRLAVQASYILALSGVSLVCGVIYYIAQNRVEDYLLNQD